jgi:hypothetical protein
LRPARYFAFANARLNASAVAGTIPDNGGEVTMKKFRDGVPPKGARGTTGHTDTRFTNASGSGGVLDGTVKITEPEKRAFSITAFCERYGIGRTSTYEEIAAGRLRVVKAGKRTLVPADAAERWLTSLPAVEPKP